MALKKPGAKPARPASIAKVEIKPEAVEEVVVQVPEEPIVVEENITNEVPVESEVVIDEPTVEEVEVVKEEQPAEEPKTTKKKTSSRKKTTTKKKEEVVEETISEPKTVLPNMSLEECLNAMVSKVNATTTEWEEEKTTISEEIESLVIDPDASPGEMKELISQIDVLLSKLKILKANCEQRNNGLLEHIDYVKYKGSTGSNSEERKTNGMEALMHYMVDPESPNSANLLELKVFITNQSNFYNEMINVLVDKKNLLITFSGLTKIEAQLGGY
jgi:hypothetical protein